VNRFTLASRPLAAAVLVAWGGIAWLGGCAARSRAPSETALRISEIESLGDARRQASTRLVLEGLDAEIASAPQRALSRYQRAIQIDSGNPAPYLALARYYAASADYERALEHLDRTQSLLAPDGALFRSAEPHLLGLRGRALAEAGRSEDAEPLLAAAGRRAPSVWGDGRLDASELR